MPTSSQKFLLFLQKVGRSVDEVRTLKIRVTTSFGLPETSANPGLKIAAVVAKIFTQE